MNMSNSTFASCACLGLWPSLLLLGKVGMSSTLLSLTRNLEDKGRQRTIHNSKFKSSLLTPNWIKSIVLYLRC